MSMYSVCVCACVRVRVHVCVCVRACACVCVCVCVFPVEVYSTLEICGFVWGHLLVVCWCGGGLSCPGKHTVYESKRKQTLMHLIRFSIIFSLEAFSCVF